MRKSGKSPRNSSAMPGPSAPKAKEAEKEGRPARILELLQSWGGATIAYRKRLIDSPSYTLNHEEVEKALEEGIWFAEGLTPVRVETDKWDHAKSVHFAVQALDEDGIGNRPGRRNCRRAPFWLRPEPSRIPCLP